MRTSTESWPGRIALMIAHCAGMIDLVALPVWVGALIAQYQFTPQQAGGLATLFLIGAVISSLFFAPRFNRIDSRTAAAAGFRAPGLSLAQSHDHARTFARGDRLSGRTAWPGDL